MEEAAAIIEKVVECYECEGTIRKFIELALFTYKIVAEMNKCDNTCLALEFLTRPVFSLSC